MKYLVFALLTMALAIGWVGCDKPPIYNDTPTIEFLRFSQDTVQQLTGVTTFVVGFTDGDGDIGDDEDTTGNLLLIDTRRTPNDTFVYRIPEIPKQGATGGISGEIEIDVAQICCIDPNFPIVCSTIPDTYHEVVYKVRIRDNADRWSNEVMTSPLTIRCYE